MPTLISYRLMAAGLQQMCPVDRCRAVSESERVGSPALTKLALRGRRGFDASAPHPCDYAGIDSVAKGPSMPQGAEALDVAKSLRSINHTWLRGEVQEIARFLHPDIVMVFPGFSGRWQGRDAFLDGFKDFVSNAKVLEYRETDEQIDVVGATATITNCYQMRYARGGAEYRATGRDFWVFQRQGAGGWLAVWRTMLDVSETPA